jgi:outer membrane receptor protein involved in Fe transport
MENLTLFLEGINLTDEDEFVFFDGQANYLRYYEERGRRLNVGVRGTF